MGTRGAKKKYDSKILLSITSEQKRKIEHYARLHHETTSGFVRSTLHKYCDFLDKKNNIDGDRYGSN